MVDSVNNSTNDALMNDDDLQRQYYELKSIDEHLKKLDKELSLVDSKVSELDLIKTYIREISNKSDSESLIPITDGIFVKAKLLVNGEFIVNVGSGVCVPKSTEDTIKLLDQQTSELSSYREQIISNMERLDIAAQNIEVEFLKKDVLKKESLQKRK